MKQDLKPESNTVDIGDAEIQYLSYPGGGPPLVLLHATGFLPWLWHPIAMALSADFTVIAPYFCDHRDAAPENGGLHWQQLAEDLRLFCQRLQLEAPLVVGHSMGGTVATLAAAAGPGLTAGLVLIEPIFLPPEFYRLQIDVEQHTLASKSIRRRNQWADAAEAKAYLRGKVLFADWDEEMLDLYVRHGMLGAEAGGLELTCHPRREASLFMGGVHLDPWPLLGRVDCPVLVVEGEKSGNRGHIDLERAAAAFPRGRFMRVAGAGHLIPMERPRETARIIGAFSRGLDG
ncbi:MAG: alpha/beta hydrolase [Desulfobacteraceae bacterium]|nr:alpha/beta hydrolase [Desulfobacteraceae bacterium]